MALLIYLKGEGKQSLIVKGALQEFIDRFEATQSTRGEGLRWFSFDGWHGKKVLVALEQISHIVEESDGTVKNNLAEAKKRAAKKGGQIIQTPQMMIPQRRES